MDTSRNLSLEQLFPQLKNTSYRITSPQCLEYNCIAWAVGKTDQWWQSGAAPGYYWPEHLPDDGSLESLVRVFQFLGFEVCEDPGLETGFEKIAVYGQDGQYEHVARQLETGKWTSKLGALEDIEHNASGDLEGHHYGKVAHILRRARAG